MARRSVSSIPNEPDISGRLILNVFDLLPFQFREDQGRSQLLQKAPMASACDYRRTSAQCAAAIHPHAVRESPHGGGQFTLNKGATADDPSIFCPSVESCSESDSHNRRDVAVQSAKPPRTSQAERASGERHAAVYSQRARGW